MDSLEFLLPVTWKLDEIFSPRANNRFNQVAEAKRFGMCSY